jgi:hypothetical protein
LNQHSAVRVLASHIRNALRILKVQIMEVKEGLDIPAPLVPSVERQPVNRIGAPRTPGGEIAVDLYRRKAPAPAKAYRDLSD